MTGPRRPRRSNSALSIVRGIAGQKTIYWTTSQLRKLLRRVVKNDRQEWFAARVLALKSWPERTKEQILEDASRINPRRLMNGRWAWPKRELEIQRELLRSAPEHAIDIDALRIVLAELDERQGERLIEMLAESELLKDTTVPLDTGLPQPKELPLGFLRRTKRLHGKLMRLIKDGHYDNDLREVDHSEVLHVPIANLKSSAGTAADMAPSDEEWAEIVDAFRAVRRPLIRSDENHPY
jgi:hypothetical protein